MATPEDETLAADKPETRRLPSIPLGVGERWLAPLLDNGFAARTWNLVTVVAICAIYAAIIGWILYRDPGKPQEAAKLEEIPVELVPPPPPPPPAQKPPPAAEKEIEKPATSAPRAPSEEKIETEKMDDTTSAPKAEAPPHDGEKAPEPTPAAPADADAHDDKAATAKDEVLKKDAEALDKAAPMPPEKPEKLAKAPPKAKLRREKTALERLTGKSDLPEYKLARPTKRAPITGGHEDNRYLSNVFAKIMANYRGIDVGPADGATCTVAFNVDDDGTILQMQIVQSSGDQELDAAAVDAVSHSSPLPPLPAGAPHGLIARIGAHAAPTVRMGGGRE